MSINKHVLEYQRNGEGISNELHIEKIDETHTNVRKREFCHDPVSMVGLQKWLA